MNLCFISPTESYSKCQVDWNPFLAVRRKTSWLTHTSIQNFHPKLTITLWICVSLLFLSFLISSSPFGTSFKFCKWSGGRQAQVRGHWWQAWDREQSALPSRAHRESWGEEHGPISTHLARSLLLIASAQDYSETPIRCFSNSSSHKVN